MINQPVCVPMNVICLRFVSSSNLSVVCVANATSTMPCAPRRGYFVADQLGWCFAPSTTRDRMDWRFWLMTLHEAHIVYRFTPLRDLCPIGLPSKPTVKHSSYCGMAATGSQASSSASAILRAKDEANDLSGVASSSSAPFQSSAPNPNHQPQSSDGPGASSPGIATGSPWTHPPNYQQYPPPLYPTAPSLQKKASTSGDGPISQRNGSGSPGPASSKTKNGKTPQTIADAVAASVGNKKERKRKVSKLLGC